MGSSVAVGESAALVRLSPDFSGKGFGGSLLNYAVGAGVVGHPVNPILRQCVYIYDQNTLHKYVTFSKNRQNEGF